ncbi:VCBS domain-containing protein [Shewanella sp. SP2S2-4]|nr:VCBS domain-containing protein [Shewanella sp. SP2S2-4]MDT3275644.1 VCBS domain-containing protein [Shewanella sp. SP2S2-4]
MNADGSYSFDPSHASYQHLAMGQTQDVVVPITVTDGTGATSTQNLTITITGTNDGPTIAGVNTGSTAEDNTQAVSGQLTIADADDGQAHFVAQTATAGSYGSLTLSEDGQWQYQLDNSKPEVQALMSTETATDTFTVHSADGSSHSITVTIQGQRDSVVIGGVDVGVVKEDVSAVTGGNLVATGESAEFVPLQQRTPLGNFAMDASGAWTYTLDNSRAGTDALKNGETATDSVTITHTDGTTHTVTVTIMGTNDAPVLSAQTQAISEDGTQLTGHMAATDVDAGDTQTFSTTTAVDGFTLNADGSYKFDPSHASYQHLAAGQTQDVIIPITVTDSAGATSTQNLTITVTGSNDGAVISGTDTGTVIEDQQVSATHILSCGGKLAVTDVDTGEATFAVQHGTGANGYGNFVLGPSGTWTYSADNTQAAIQQLKAGETLTDTFTVSSTDGTTHTLTVTIQGTNDAPVLAAQTQAVTEDGTQLSGHMVATDVDSGDTQTFSIAHAVDGFTLNADGSYSFDPSHASYQHLAAGQTQDVVIPITVTDGSGATATQNLTIRLTGTNDAARISGTDIGRVVEDQTLSASGQLQICDTDDGQAHFIAQTATAGSYGSLTLGEDGHWQYQLDNSKPEVQALKSTDTATDSFTVHSADGSSHSITVTIQGQRDNVVIGGVDVGVVKEDVSAVTGGHLVATGESAEFVPLQQRTTLGNFAMDASGAWTYTLDNSRVGTQSLKAGETATDTVTITHTDGTTHTVTVTIMGTNDAPVLSAQIQAVTEDGTQLSGHMVATDVDAGDTQTFSTTTAVDGFTLNADGSYQFDPSHASYQHLAAGQTQDVIIPITVTDSAGATSTQNLTFTVTGSNDGAVISGTDTGTVIEDQQVSATHILSCGGKLGVTDVDTGEATFAVQHGTGANGYGSFVLGPSGTWTYSADNTQAAIQQLKAGETLTDTFTVSTTDGTTHTVTVTLQGTNDAPVLAAQSQAVTEDGSLLSGHMAATDVDAGDTQAFSLANAVDGFTLNADGSYSFDPSNAAYQHLAAGQTQDVVIPITVTDSAGATSTQNLTITLTGSNDGPLVTHGTVATAADLGAINEDAPRVFTEAELLQAVGASDVDDGSSLHIVDGSLTSAHGTFTGDAAHGYTFTPAANFSGQDVDLQFSVSDGTVSREAHGQLDITPVADKPVGPLVSTTFDDVQLSGQFADPALLGWKTDSTFGVEQTTEDVFGGTGKNQVLELVSKGASINSPNIYRELDTQTGQWLHVSFDASRRENWDVARIEVLWEGKVIDAFTPGTAGYEMHHHEYDLQATGPQSRIEFRVVGDDADKRAIIDNIQIGLPTQVGEVNQALHLDMGQAFQLADTDGSETLSYLIKGLPPGFTLTDGMHSVTIASVGQVVDTKGWSQDALALRAPQDYQGQLEIQVSARAEETANHQTATSDQQSLRLSFDRLTAVEDTPQTFSASRLLQLAGIRAGLGEVLTLDDVQVNPAFGHFSHNADGSWTFTPEANVSAHQVPLTLTVHGGAQPISSTLHLDITPVADTPLLDLPADGQLTAIHTDFDSTLLHGQFADPTPLGWHTDGPQGSEVARQDVFGGSGGDHALELISEGAGAVNSPNLYRVLDVASGQMVRFGFDVSPRNSWAVPLVEVLWEGKVIDSFTPSGTGFGLQHHDYDLLATAGQPRLEIRVVGAQSDMRAIFDNLDVGVSPVAARFSPVNGDAYLDLGAQFHLADTDGSETLSYVVKGLPQGFTLTDGTHSITVTTAGQAIETKGWDQAALVVKAPQDFQGQVNLQVSGVAEESGTQQTASSPELSMRLSFEQLRVYEDTPQVFTESKLLQLAGVHAPAGQAMTLADVQVDQAFGQFSHNANGSWTFTPASNVNADDVPFTLTIAGGSQPLSRPLQLSIAPVNDAPVLAAQSQTGTEDGSPITGHMVATDVDVGDTQSFSLAHPVDGFTLNADGSYSFDPSHASYQHLAAGQTQDVVIPITVTDHAGATGTQNLTFTLTGTNDGLQVVANSAAKAGDLGAVDEDAPRLFTEAELLRAVGASDVDDGNDLHIVAGSLSSTHGTFTGDAAHGFTFTPSANFSGQQVDVQFSVSDGGVNQATFARLDIRPVADVPVFEYTGETHSLAHQTDFDSTLLHGQFADPTPLGWHTDAPQGSEVARQDVFGGSGGDRALEMISSGAGKDSSANFYRVLDTVPGQELKFSFDVSPRSGWAVPLVEVLWEGKVIDSFTPSGSDFSLQRHDYQLTATGEHSRLELRVVGDQSDMRAIFDKLEISDTPHLDREALVNSELQLHLPTNLHLADTDGSETLSYLIKGLPVGFSLTDGSHSITVTAADQVIDTKGWNQDALAVQAPKDFAGTLDLSVTGHSEEAGNQQTANSAELPLHLSFERVSVVEDTPLTLSESKLLALAGVVPAAGEHLSLSDVQVDPALGQFSHNADGSWTFTPAANVNADQVPFTLTVSGGAQPISSSLQLSITPVNDAPVIAAQTQAVTEDGSLLSGHMAATDADAGDTHTFSLGTAVDGFTLNTDGSYSFDPGHASYQHIAAGQTQDVVIPITVTDSAGATSTQNLTITLTGSNDGPLVTHGTAATAADLGAINEDAPRVFTEAELLQAVGASDVDDGAQLHIVAGSLTSAHGTFTGDAAHGYTFTPAANYSGQDVDLQFSVSDGTVSREAHGQLDITPVADTLRVSELPESGQAKTLVSSVDFQAHTSFERMPATVQGWNNEGGDLHLERANGGANTRLVMRGTDDATVGTHFATKPGQIYELTLSAYSSGNIKLDVVWNGQVVSSYTPEGGWGAEHSFRFLADSDQGYLQLRTHDGAGQFAHVNVDYTQLRMREPLPVVSTQPVSLGGLDTFTQFHLMDTDGSETLSYVIKGLPVGFTLSDGSHSVTVTKADQVIDTQGWAPDQLHLMAPTGFEGVVGFQVAARSEEGANHQQGALTAFVPQALSFDSPVVIEDTPRHFSEAQLLSFAGLHAAAGVSYGLSDVQVDAAFGHFTHNGDGSWTFTPAANVSADQVPITLTVTGGAQPLTASLALSITPVVDTPLSAGGQTELTDFNHQAVGSAGWAMVDPSGMGWHTDHAQGVELGQDKLYGGSSTSNQIVSLSASSDANLYRDLSISAGEVVHFGFDLSARAGVAIAPLQVLWEGKVIDTITPTSGYAMAHHEYDLVATGANSRLELRATGSGDARALIDNLQLSTTPPQVALVNHALHLDLGQSFQLADTDGSETLSYLIKDLPVGFTLSDGSHSVTATTAGQQIDLKGWQLDALVLQSPADFEGQLALKVSASAEEGATHQIATSAELLLPLSFERLSTAEDTPRSFSERELLQLAGAVPAPGQHLSLSDVQVDPAFGQITHNADGSWTFTPAANVSADQVALNLTVAGGAQPQQVALPLQITAVTDAPVAGMLSIHPDISSQNPGSAGWAYLDPPQVGWHTDHHEGVYIGTATRYGGADSHSLLELSGLASSPMNFYRTLNTQAGQTLVFSFDLTGRPGRPAATIEVLFEGKVIDTLTPGNQAYDMQRHEYVLTATGPDSRLELRPSGQGDARALFDNLQISPPPQVALVNHALHLDVGQAFHLADTDGSETISYLINGLPVGFTLSDGSHSVTVTTAGQVIDTAGWQMDAVTVEAPKDFEGQIDLKISARTEESATHQTVTSAELPLPLSFERLSTAEDTPRSFSEHELLQLAGVVPAAGEHLSLSDVQVDPAFGHVTHNADGSWTFTPVANVSADQVALNLTVTGGAQAQQLALPIQITAVTDAPLLGAGVSSSDFEQQRVTDSSGSQFYDPTQYDWHSYGVHGVEVGRETSFGGSHGDNQVVELISQGASGFKDPNLYRDLTTFSGQQLHFAFDLSRRAGWAVGPVEVLWEGKVIDTITPTDSGFAFHHHAYDLVATGASGRLELRVPGNAVDQRAVVDNLYVGPPPQMALVNHDLHLKVDDYVRLADSDGSETLSLLIKGLPVGFTLTDGSHSVTVTAADQVIDTQGWQQDALSIQSTKDFAGTLNLSISGRSEEGSTHQTATTAELPVRLSFESLATTEDTALTLDEDKLLALAGVVPAAGEHLSLSDVQVDPAFGQVTHNADGSWTFTPAANVSADQVALNLTVAGGAQPITAHLPLSITPVTDAPVITPGVQGSMTDFDSLALGSKGWDSVDPTPFGWHTDGSGRVEAAQDKLYGGSSNTNVEVSLIANAGKNLYQDLSTGAGKEVHLAFDLSARPGFSKAPLEVLWEGKVIDTITPGADGYAMQHHEYDLVAASDTSRIELRVVGSGDVRILLDNIQISPTLTRAALVNHDLQLDLTPALHLADTDGSETLTYFVKGLPVGFTLTDGEHSVTVATADQVIETTGWNPDTIAVRPPQDFQGQLNLQVSARAEETANHQTATSADMAVRLSFDSLVLTEDTPKTFSEAQLLQFAGIRAPAGQTYTLADVQVDPAFGQVTHNANGGWTFTPAANVSADAVPLTLHVSGGVQPITGSLTLSVTPVVDAPVVIGVTGSAQRIVTDFDSVLLHDQFADPTPLGWKTDSKFGVEQTTEDVFGGSGKNHVLELVSQGASTNSPNIYKDLPTKSGQMLHLSFDLSPRSGWAVAPVEVLWEGKVIDVITLTPGGYAMQTHAYDVLATGADSRLEIRIVDDHTDARAILDNVVVESFPTLVAATNHDLYLDLTSNLRFVDTDGSEALTYIIKGLPVGFTLTDGTHSATVATAGQVIETTGWNPDTIAVRAPQDFHGRLDLQVSARTEEIANHQSATSTEIALQLSFESLSTAEDKPRTFTEGQLLQLAGIHAPAGQTYTLGDVQVDPALGHVTHEANGSWTFTPAANVSADAVPLTLHVDGGAQPITGSLTLSLTPVADAPVHASAFNALDFDSDPNAPDKWVKLDDFGWSSNNREGIERVPEDVYHGDPKNRIATFSSQYGDHHSLYHDLATRAGEAFHFSFDTAWTTEYLHSKVPIEVLWEGKVIDTLLPTAGDDLTWAHHKYDLVATGTSSRLELRVAGNGQRGMAAIDNLAVGPATQFAATNHDLALDTGFRFVDTDGSETFGYVIKGLPLGFTLTDGTHSVKVATADQAIDTKGWDQDALAVRAPQGFEGELNLRVVAQSEETANHQTATSDVLPLHLSFIKLGVAEDTPKTFTDAQLLGLSGIRAPAGQTYTLGDVQVDPAFGHFSHDANGSWTFTPAANVNADQVPLTLTVTGGAQPISTTLQLAITPVNDGPVLAAQTQAVTEDAAVFNGHVLASDPDAGDTLAFSTTATADGFTLNADGSYSFDPTHASYQHLATGQTQDIVIPVTVADHAGATATQNLTITVTGANDGPLVTHATAATAADLGAINEDAPRLFTEAELLQAVGASDVDDGAQLHIVAGSLSSAHGTFTGDAAHGFTFTPAANFSGQDVDLKFSVSDGTVSRDAFATLDITPVADAPVRGGLSITTDFNSVDVGAGGWKLSDPTPLGWQSSEASGVEIGQERLYGGSGNNQILSLTASWSSNIFRDLATQAGQKVHVGFDLSARPGFAMTPVEVVWEGKVVDTISPTAGTFAMQHHAYDLVATGSSSRLEFRATGQGEARALFDNIQIGTPDHLTLGDQDILLKPYLGYQLADTDGSETLSYAIHGLPVGFTLTDGTHSATVATAGQVIETTGWNQDALALRAPHGFQGDTSIQVSARAEEGSNHQSASAADFTLHLSGVPVSHVAVIGGDTAVTVTEDQQVNSQGNLEHFGQLSIVDPDAGQALFVPQNAVGATYGHYTIDQTGYWLYEADNKLAAIQQLKTGEHLTDTFTVHSADGTAQTITVTIQGQDDAPAFVPHAGPTQSDDAYAQIGHAFEWMSHPNFKYLASMMLQGADTYPFERALVIIKNAGISFISPDGSVAKAFGPHGGTLTEVPISEMIAWHAKGAGYQVVFTDAKASEVGVYAYNNGNPGMLSGRHPYTDFVLHPEQNAAQLTPVMHDVAAASGGAAVQGSGFMPPAIAPLEFDSAHVLEDNGQLISGFIEVKDADAGQSAMKPQTDTATHYGRFSIDANGDWVYQIDNSRAEVQQLADGQTLVDTITVHSEDGKAHEVSITIHDQNDGAVIAGADSGSVVEDNHVIAAGAIVAKGELTVTDAITGNNDQPLPSNTAKGDIGNLSELSLSSSHGTPLTTTDAHFTAQASPVDHYLQMLGLSPTTVSLSPSVPVELLPTLSSSNHFNDIDAPMHAIPEVNHFENPLLDNEKEQHKDRHFDLFDVTELHTNPNDDDLLHSALNDMHNQM